jgi:hypothetical protein
VSDTRPSSALRDRIRTLVILSMQGHEWAAREIEQIIVDVRRFNRDNPISNAPRFTYAVSELDSAERAERTLYDFQRRHGYSPERARRDAAEAAVLVQIKGEELARAQSQETGQQRAIRRRM